MIKDDEKIVPHPRYGNAPMVSGDEDAVALALEILGRKTFRGTVFPESAILADPSKQNYTVIPRKLYVDEKRSCRDCGRFFIFFAKEQQYWFEELKFFIDSECVRCPECRRSEKTLRCHFARYGRNIHATDLDDDALATLVDDAIFLWEHTLLKNEQVIYRLRKLARSRLPDHKATRKIDAVIDIIRSQNKK
jgi:hypothetical protein